MPIISFTKLNVLKCLYRFLKYLIGKLNICLSMANCYQNVRHENLKVHMGALLQEALIRKMSLHLPG